MMSHVNGLNQKSKQKCLIKYWDWSVLHRNKKHVMLSEDGQTILDHNNSNHALTAARIDALNNHAYSDCSVGTRTAKP